MWTAFVSILPPCSLGIEHGRPADDAPILWEIDTDPVLAGRKLIAEAWDPGGLYLVGSFGGDRWKEWNGRFRDDVRRFLKSDRNTVLNLRQRILGSPDIYTKRRTNRQNKASIS
jgi:isoamylase